MPDNRTNISTANLPSTHNAPTAEQEDVEPTDREMAVVAVTENCGNARSHAEYLEMIAERNSAVVQQTEGGGNCFFSAISIALAQVGMHRTITELRDLAATVLEINAAPDYDLRT